MVIKLSKKNPTIKELYSKKFKQKIQKKLHYEYKYDTE